MKQPSQEDLLGYVLGALDAQDHHAVQQQIDQDPQLEEQLLDIRNSLLPLEMVDEAAGALPGLARRTCEMVASVQKGHIIDHALTTEPPMEAQTSEAPPSGAGPAIQLTRPEPLAASSGWSRSDLLVAVASLLIFAGLLFPAVSYTRYNSRLVGCQQNLATLGQAFMVFSNQNASGNFVSIPDAGNLAVSGCYAPILKQAGLLEDDSVVRCQGTGLDSLVCVPTIERVEAAAGAQLRHLQRTMGGDYGYSLGYMVNNHYQGPRNEGRAFVVLLADRPSPALPGRRSGNHRGNGQNCLFEDGHVEFVRGHAYGEDPLFENDLGMIGAGLHMNDNVIAPSDLSPRAFEVKNLQFRAGSDAGDVQFLERD